MPLNLGGRAEPTIEVLEGGEAWSLENQPEYIKDLIWCESGGNPKARGDGGKAYGLLQFHLPTAWAYNQKYKVLPNLEKHELLNVIEDPYFQVELTKKIILDGGAKNWYNCGKKIGLIQG